MMMLDHISFPAPRRGGAPGARRSRRRHGLSRRLSLAVAVVAAAVAVACGGNGGAKPAASAQPPAKVENRVTEQQLTRVTLSEAAEQRLGIELAEAMVPTGARATTLAGEVVLPPGQALLVTAPVSGTVQPRSTAQPGSTVQPGSAVQPGSTVQKGQALLTLTPLVSPQRDLSVTIQADADATRARLAAATQQLERARTLLKEQAGSQRGVEQAEQEFAQAKALADAAAVRLAQLKTHPLDADVQLRVASPARGILRQLLVAPGQAVSAGAPLFEVADLRRVWVRVPVYAADRRALQGSSSVEVRDIDGGGPLRRAKPVSAPPSADPLALTTDLYFQLENADDALRPGQRLSVRLPDASTTPPGAASVATPAHAETIVTVPASAIVYDAQGGAWLYVLDAPRVYRRQRVDILDTAGSVVSIARGLKPGAKVVTVGVAELFGTEFGAGK